MAPKSSGKAGKRAKATDCSGSSAAASLSDASGLDDAAVTRIYKLWMERSLKNMNKTKAKERFAELSAIKVQLAEMEDARKSSPTRLKCLLVVRSKAYSTRLSPLASCSMASRASNIPVSRGAVKFMSASTMQGKASLGLAFLSLWRHRMLMPKDPIGKSGPLLTKTEQADAKQREDAILGHLTTSAKVRTNRAWLARALRTPTSRSAAHR